MYQQYGQGVGDYNYLQVVGVFDLKYWSGFECYIVNGVVINCGYVGEDYDVKWIYF